MSSDGLFCDIKAIGRFSEESCDALPNQGKYATTKYGYGDVGVGNCGVRRWQVCEIDKWNAHTREVVGHIHMSGLQERRPKGVG